jgi:isoquinoline 1-oxidoreductase subunit beta
MAQAAAALLAIEITWREPERPLQQADLEGMLADGRNPTMLKTVGDVEAALLRAKPIARQYRTGFSAHAQIEPMVGVADVRADSAAIWAPTQAPLLVRSEVAKVVGLADDQVIVNATMIGGGFGRKALAEAAIEAARLSKAARGPVKVLWNRVEEFQQGFAQPLTITDFTGTLDDQGRIAAWDQHLATSFVLFTFFPAMLRWLIGSDSGATRAAVGLYTAPNQRVAATVKQLPVRTGSWRGLGLLPNTFATEQFMDELATEAKADPVDFRLRHLPDDQTGRRLRRVIETVAQQAGWGTALPADHGRGIACCADAETVVAEVAEVRVDRASGAVQVLKVTAAVDCGLVINPDNAVAQIEGAIMMGLSAALKEELTVKDGQWSATDFAAYPILTIADAPEIAVTLIDSRDTPPGGLGEPPIGPIGAAVANAIAAIGARVRTMPMTPPRVREALRQQIEAGRTGNTQEAGMTFPVVTGSNLSGKRYTLPQDFEGDYNAVVLPYLIEQQASVETWNPALQRLAEQYPTFRYYEVPVLRNYNWLRQRYIDQAMRSGIPAGPVRDRTITLYLDVANFNQSLGLPSIDTIYILLVNRAGEVLWQAAGAYTPEQGEALAQKLAERARSE